MRYFIITIALLLTTQAQAAGYLKIGDIKGESQGAPAAQHVEPPPPKTNGLLLPAVQKVRDAPASRAGLNPQPGPPSRYR